jgi:2-polyprenyl-3-methyl-5-hydroxy-6-metoxy-1,4-benzoquinol methylase
MDNASPDTDYADQKRHFDEDRNQYSRDAIIHPPLHTTLELRGVIDTLEGVPISEHVVDFGAGTGRLSVALAKVGYSVLATDISERSLATLDDVAHELDLQTIQTSTAFPNCGTFGAVVGSDVLHHVDLDEFLPKFHSVLQAGGKIAFSEPGGMNPVWYIYLSAFYDMRVERRIVHCNLRTLRRKLIKHGFSDVKITGVGLLPRPLFGWNDTACRLHDRSGDLPVLRWVANRYLIEATK